MSPRLNRARIRPALLPAAWGVLAGFLPLMLPAQMPQKPTVVNGDVHIATGDSQMNVTQGSRFGIINWDSFSVGAGHTVHFANGTGATLNRVTGLTASQIDGTLSATGSLYLLNRNGIIIGADGKVLTGGTFVASTLDVADADFLDGGAFTLFGDSPYGVTNLGKITSSAGDVLLAGYTVTNHGAIDAPAGRVGLTAGPRVDVLTDTGWMNGAFAVSLGERGNDVTNDGRIRALVAELRTHAGNIYALAGNNDGLIQATGVRNEGGRVILTADGGTVESSGTIVATRDRDGGDIGISASEIDNYGGTQDVSGANGGTIRLTADSIVTDTAMLARGVSGDGGTVAIEAGREILFTAAGRIDAGGATAGGEVAIDAGGGALALSGTVGAVGGTGPGGRVSLWGDRIALLGGTVDASGGAAGGTITVGGGLHGGPVWTDGNSSPLADVANAQRTYVSDASVLRADATGANGRGGEVVVWADGTTEFAGQISARGGTAGGDGGTVETSGLEGLGVGGTVDAGARGTGANGTWLLDPRNLTIGTTTDPLTEFQSVVSIFGGHPTDTSPYLDFGLFLDVSGSVAVVGTHVASGSSVGAVYVFDSGHIAARLTASGTSSYFGAGVGVEGDYVMVMDQQESILHTFTNQPGYYTTGAVHLYYKGTGWRNGSVNQIARLYNDNNRDGPFDSQWGAVGPSLFDGNNPRFDTMTDADGNITIVVGNPLADWSYTDGGAVDFYTFAPGYAPHGDVTGWYQFTPDFIGTPDGLHLGEYVTASNGYIYAGTGTTVSARQNDLYVYKLWSNLGAVRFPNYFGSVGRPSYVTADGTSLFAITGDSKLYFDTFEWPAADNYLTTIHATGLRIVPLDTTAMGGYTYNPGQGAGAVAVDGNELIVSGYWGSTYSAAIYEKPANYEWSWGPNGSYAPAFTYAIPSATWDAAVQAYNFPVALSGNYAVVGLPNVDHGSVRDNGAVAQFQKTNGSWAFTGNLTPAMLYEYSGFGDAVAADGNTFVIADPYYGEFPGAGGYSGRLYVFENGALAATLANPTGLQSNLGWDVAIDGGVIAAVAPYASASSVILYSRGSGWTNGTGNVTSTYRGSDAYYTSVDIANGTVVAGASTTNVAHQGAVDVFTLSNNGTTLGTPVRLTSSLLGSTPTVDDNFGYRVATSGNAVAVLTAPGWVQNSGANPTASQIIIFENLNNNWLIATPTVLASSAITNSLDGIGWGFSLAMRDDTLVTGYGYLYGVNGGGPGGRGVYVFERNGTWADSTAPVARLTGDGYGYGYAVDTDGTRIVISAPASANRVNVGSTTTPTTDPVYVYTRGNGWRNDSQNLIATLVRGTDAGALPPLGYTVAISGDVVVAGNSGASYNPVGAYFFTGPFGYSDRATFSSNPGDNLNISATSLAHALSLGTDIALQANNDITITSAITVNNPNGDGGNLSLFAGRDLLVNASIFTDNGDLTLVAGDPRANAAYRGTGERVVVLGRDAGNVGVTLDLGTGNLVIAAADRFENRTGGTSPFLFNALTPGRYLVYTQSPDHTGAPDATNLGADLAITGRDFVYYHQGFDVNNLVPSSLPAGNGFVYAVQPAVVVNVGDAAITYGQAVPAASLSLASLTLGGSAVSSSVFDIGASDLANLVTTGLAGSVSVGTNGYVNAGTYTGGITAVARSTVSSGGVYGVAVTTGAAGNLTVGQATLDVRPDDASRPYHTDDPTFGVTYTGFVGGDDASVLDTPVSVTSAAGLTSDVGGYTLAATGGADHNYTFHVTGTGLLTITPADLPVTGLTGVDRTYNQSDTGSVGGTASISPYAGDTVALAGTLSALAQFNDANVGANKPITITGLSLTGADAVNYTLVLPTNLTASITPATLTLTGVTAQNRPYDGSTDVTTAGTAAVTPLAGDNVALTGSLTAAFVDKAVGANKDVTLAGVSLTGAAAGNYILLYPALTATVTPLTLNVTGLSALSRVYDRTTTATLTGTAAVSPVAGDDVALTGTATGAFDTRTAGTGKPVTVGGLSLTGLDAGNYALYFPTLFADITRAPLVVTGVTGVDRAYDGTRVAYYSGVPTVTPIAGDSVTVTGAGTGTFADKNAGTDKAVTLTGFGIGGFDAANYYVVQPIGLTADIRPRLVTVTGGTLGGKTYDGTVTATYTGTPVFGNLVAGDDAAFVVNSPVFSFPLANAGYYQNLLLSGVTLTGADAANYDTTRIYNLGGSIAPAALHVTGVSPVSRAYDGTSTVAVTGGTLTGVIGSDDVTLSTAGAVGAMTNKNVGTDKSVSVTGYTVTGAAAGNYYVAQVTGLTVDITAYTLNLVGLNGDKTYDGTALAALTFSSLDAVFGHDDVTVDATAVTATYADKNAGAGKAISLSGLFTLAGADAANYLLNQPGALTGTIARRAITVSGLTIADKVYDGTTAGEISGTGTFGGAIAGDDLTIDVGAVDVTFADKNVGTNKAVALSGVTLAGADAGNYTAATPTGITGTITTRDVAVTGISALDRTYDRTTAATLAGTGTLDGVVAGDLLGLNESGRTGAFADKNAGEDKTVGVSGLTLTGTDAGNYHLVAPTLTASIARADASVVGLAALDRIYDTTTGAALSGTAAIDFGLLNSVMASSEDVSLAGTASAAFADKNVGTGKAVAVTGLTLAGADARNYVLHLPTSLTANVTPATLAVTGAAVAGKVYDANATATFATVGSVTALGDDAVALVTSGATATFASKNVGTGKAVAATGYTLTGADAGNYQLVQPAGLTADITPADLVLSGLVANAKTYDGTTAAPIGGTLAVTALGSDRVSIAGTPAANFADRNAGAAKAVTVTGLTATGADAANYRLVIPNLLASILRRVVNVTGLSAVNRLYDGTTAITLAGTAGLSNLVSGDTVTFSTAAVSAKVADKNVGTNKAVTLTGGGLVGADADNYLAVLPFNLTATISPRALSLSGVAATNRAYDGTVNVALTGGMLSGAVAGDAVQLGSAGAAGTVADKNVGAAKAVTATGYTVTGGDAGNYTLAQPAGLTVDITPRSVAITGLTVADKFYDGTTTATLSGGTLGNTIAGDDVRLLTGTGRGTFNTPDVGNDKPVTPLDLALAGNDAGNYQLDAALDVRGNILASLRVITDIIPAEVLHATSDAAVAQQRATLAALNAAQPDAVQLVNYDALNGQIGAGIVVPNVSSVLTSLPAGQQDALTIAYTAAASAARSAAAAAQAIADQYRDAARDYKEAGQALNAADRDLKTEQALRGTFVAQIATAQTELAKVDENLATIAEAKRRIATLTQQMADANRLGRGSEAADLAKAIAQAQTIVATESTVLAQRSALAGQVQSAQSQLAASAAKVAALTAQKADLAGKLAAAEGTLRQAQAAIADAKAKAVAANDKLEQLRQLGEQQMGDALRDADAKVAALQNPTGPSVAQQVDAVMAKAGTDRGSIGMLTAAYPLSPERTAAVQAVADVANAKIAQIDALTQKVDALNAVVQGASPIVSVRSSEVLRSSVVAGKSSAELAALDPHALGIKDADILPSDTGAIVNLNAAADGLANRLAALGPMMTVAGPKTPAAQNTDGSGDRGLANLDQPVSFDPAVEKSLKTEMQNLGVLPTFTSPALQNLSLTDQLMLTNAMKTVAAAQQAAVAAGQDPDAAALKAVDAQTMSLITTALFEHLDAYGVGDVPGTQAFVGAALGELSAQFGISPGAMAATVISGNTSAMLGAPQQALSAITSSAAKVVSNPAAAGVSLAKSGYEVVKAGAEAFVGAWTGSGPPPDPAAAQRAVEQRIAALNSVASSIVSVESSREAAVAQRDQALDQVKQVVVAQAAAVETRGELGALPPRDSLVQQRDADVLAARTEAVKAQITDQVAAQAATEQKAKEAALAAAQAERNLINTKLSAYSAGGTK